MAKWKAASHIQWRDRAGFSPASLLCPRGHPKRPTDFSISTSIAAHNHCQTRWRVATANMKPQPPRVACDPNDNLPLPLLSMPHSYSHSRASRGVHATGASPLLPLSLTSCTASPLYSAENVRRLPPPCLSIIHSYCTFVLRGVSTNSGQVHQDRSITERYRCWHLEVD